MLETINISKGSGLKSNFEANETKPSISSTENDKT